MTDWGCRFDCVSPPAGTWLAHQHEHRLAERISPTPADGRALHRLAEPRQPQSPLPHEHEGGRFRFRLKAGNGEILSSSETYESQAAAKNGVASVSVSPKRGSPRGLMAKTLLWATWTS